MDPSQGVHPRLLDGAVVIDLEGQIALLRQGEGLHQGELILRQVHPVGDIRDQRQGPPELRVTLAWGK